MRARASHRRHRRRLAATVVAAVAVLAADVGLQVAIGAAERERDLAEAARVTAELRVAGRDGQITAADATAAHDREQARRSEDRTEQALTVIGSAQASTAEGRVVLGGVATEAGATSAQLNGILALVETSNAQIGDLQACLGGVSAASAATRAGSTSGAVVALQAATEACARARAAAGQIDPTVRFPYDFPDPFVMAADGGYYAYATNSAGGAVQLLRSTDLGSWSFAGTALSGVPGWAVPGATWAPSVLRRGGGWVLYYAVRDRASGRQCISAATAGRPSGPFTDLSAGPLVCELDQGGSIDASPFVAPDGSATLLWKAEGETTGGRATLRGAPLAADGLSLAGPAVVLLGVSQSWEGRTIEGPSMVATDIGFVLLYSANRWDTGAYAVGAATCSTPLGPCTKVPGPILATDGAVVGPGGAEAFVDSAGAVRVAFHAWQHDDVGYPEHRYLHIGRLITTGGLAIEVE